MDLDSMKYADLQSLAKQLGLKANMKKDKLLKAIKQHYKEEEEAGGQDRDQDAVKETSSPRVFVNARRGKGHRDAGKTTSGAAVTPKAARTDPEPEASSSSSTTRRASKRRASSDQTSPEPQEELQPDACVEAPARVETDPEPKPKVSKAGKIPRYRGSQQKAAFKPLTPNFKKLHEAHFNKMESIDTYVERKKRKMDTLKNPVKELKSTNAAGSSMFSPLPGKKPAGEKGRHTSLSASKAPSSRPAGGAAPFRPSVLSTRRINVRFSEATRDNEFKGSLLKTPARMSLCLVSSTPQAAGAGAGPHAGRPSAFSAQKTPRTFVFNGNTSLTPGTQKKATFDLKASLARPLTYKPHAGKEKAAEPTRLWSTLSSLKRLLSGKLKPFAEVKENAAANKSLNSHQESYKRHKVQSREDRRTQQAQGRKQKKESMLGARRGLVTM